MANEQNLKPRKTLSKEEAKRLGAAGGKASAEAKRRRKTLRQNMEILLELPVSDKRKYNKLARMQVDAEDIDNTMLLSAALFQRAAEGDVAAYREIRDLVDETKKERDDGSVIELIEGLRDGD